MEQQHKCWRLYENSHFYCRLTSLSEFCQAEYKSELERLRVELERLSPNLKAVDQLQGVAENVQAGLDMA